MKLHSAFAVLATLLSVSSTSVKAQRNTAASNNPNDVAIVAIVNRLEDTTAVTEIVRRSNGKVRNLILIPRGHITPITIGGGLSVLMRSRRLDGREHTAEIRIFQHNRTHGRDFTSEMKRVVESYYWQLRAAPRVRVEGVGAVQAIAVQLAQE